MAVLFGWIIVENTFPGQEFIWDRYGSWPIPTTVVIKATLVVSSVWNTDDVFNMIALVLAPDIAAVTVSVDVVDDGFSFFVINPLANRSGSYKFFDEMIDFSPWRILVSI